MKNPQTTIALTFLTHIISAVGGVHHFSALLIIDNLITSQCHSVHAKFKSYCVICSITNNKALKLTLKTYHVAS